MSSLQEQGLPEYDAVKDGLRKGDPHHSAWGLYGENDELGTLNRLTNGRVVEAARSEIVAGTRISLNLPLSLQTPSQKSFFNRALFHQDLIHKAPRIVNDDIWTFNTQISSQWDGLRHFAYQKEQKFYNGVTLSDIHGEGFIEGDTTRDARTSVNGIQAIAKQGIIGRCILIDYHTWRLSLPNPPPYDPFTTTAIPLSTLLSVLESQKTTIKFGDILLIRTGYGAAYNLKSEVELSALKSINPPYLGGVQQSEEMLRWIWENFSAVGGDQPSFECWR
ncbi:hypothetical protein B7494_g7111 [Chlorociboria aeruginascens]|nr:hypothetical protein B7494_g7111 [Chlorociboria aeruginascens]